MKAPKQPPAPAAKARRKQGKVLVASRKSIKPCERNGKFNVAQVTTPARFLVPPGFKAEIFAVPEGTEIRVFWRGKK